MKTPKLIASEISIKYWYGIKGITKEQSNQRALICVDEILAAVTTIADKKYDYWSEVKLEIEKL